jgi:RNA polymerase sigma-70 factor, ECF subfamily
MHLGVSLFRGVARIANMIGGAITGSGAGGTWMACSTWEGRVGVESEVARLKRGDLDALSELIARYQNRVYRFLLRLVRQPAEAEDLFQQTWLRLAERIRHFDANRNFEAWLFTLARNLAIDHLRRIRPESLDEPVVGDASGETAADRLVSRERPALEGILERERSGRLAEVLETLPMSYREVLTLRFEEEMKLEEIAQVIGAPLSTVKSRLRRSLEQMRERLEAGYPGEEWR